MFLNAIRLKRQKEEVIVTVGSILKNKPEK